METNERNNSLIGTKEDSIFIKIKKFFKRIFLKKEVKSINVVEDQEICSSKEKENFKKDIRKIEDENIKLLKLQKQYIDGQVKEEELSKEQVNKLCELFDKQILNLKKSNEILEKRILEYKKRLQEDG